MAKVLGVGDLDRVFKDKDVDIFYLIILALAFLTLFLIFRSFIALLIFLRVLDFSVHSFRWIILLI